MSQYKRASFDILPKDCADHRVVHFSTGTTKVKYLEGIVGVWMGGCEGIVGGWVRDCGCVDGWVWGD